MAVTCYGFEISDGDIKFDDKSAMFWDDSAQTLTIPTLNLTTLTVTTLGVTDITVAGDLVIPDDGLFLATNTDRLILIADGTNYNPEVLNLGTDTTGNFVADITGGTGIDSTGATTGENISHTLSFNSTEIDATTWSDGANASNVHTFDVSGTDTTMTAGNGEMIFSHKVGIGVSPTQKFEIGSTDNSDRISIFLDNTNAWFTWSDGALNFTTSEGTDTISEITIKGKGDRFGLLRIFDENNAERFDLWASSGRAFFTAGGTSPLSLELQSNAATPIRLFSAAPEGRTQELQIYGRRTGDSLRSFQVGVGVDANDTASLDGVSNLYADMNIGIKTTTPDTTLQVVGTAGFGDDGGNEVLISGTGDIKHAGSSKFLNLTWDIETFTSDDTLDAENVTVLLDGSSNTVTAGLPTAVGIEGRVYYIKSIDATNTTDIDPNGSETIDGDSSNLILLEDVSVTLISDGSNWQII